MPKGSIPSNSMVSFTLLPASLALILVMSVVDTTCAQKPFEYYAQRYDWSHSEPYVRIEHIDIKLSPEKPRLGDEVMVKALVTSPEDVFHLGTVFEPFYGVGFTSGRRDNFCVVHYKQNETKKCSTRVGFASSPAVLQVRVTGRIKTSDGKEIPVEGMKGFRLEIPDKDTGEAESTVEFFQDPWLSFDPLTGERHQIHPAVAELNRKWIKEVKGFWRSVTDLEALYLYRDIQLLLAELVDESLFLHEDTGWKLSRGWAELLRGRSWLKGFRTGNRAYATNTPESIERHVSWLKQRLLAEPDERVFDDSSIRRLEEYYGEKWERYIEPPTVEPPERAPYGSLEAKLEIDHAPTLGETARVTLSVVSYWDFPNIHLGIDVGREYNVDRPPGIEIVRWPEGFEIEYLPERAIYSQLGMNEHHVYEFLIKVTSEGVKYVTGGAAEAAHPEMMVAASEPIYLDVGETETRILTNPPPRPRMVEETPTDIRRRGAAQRKRRFALIVLIVVAELALLVFLTQKLPLRHRRRGTGV